MGNWHDYKILKYSKFIYFYYHSQGKACKIYWISYWVVALYTNGSQKILKHPWTSYFRIIF